MNLSPTARWILTGLSAGVATLGGLIASNDVAASLPPWVGIVVAVLGAVFGALNVIPPQVGGTQQGVVSPSITEPPPIDTTPPF